MGTTRSKTITKGYIAIFVCCVRKAVYIEVVTSLTTEAVLAALTRLVASAKEGDADRTYRRYCPVRAWTRLRFLEGARDRRWL